jgi:pyruvate/2-oxoglutarate dehydrogenase complex dihydrolipoamide acyltransferase (E2) component
MNILNKKTLLAAGLACSLGLGALAYADSDAPAATPPPAAPASAPAAAPAKNAPTFGWRTRWRMAMQRHRMRRLAHWLQLDKSQRAQFREIRAKAMAKIWTARADEQLTQDQRIERIRSAVEGGRSEFRSILNPAQQAKLQKLEDFRERRLLGM